MNNLSKILKHLILIVFSFIWIYPFVWMLSASFKSKSEFFESGLSLIPNSLDFSNFIRAWNEANFSQYFLNSVIITASAILIILVITSTCGYALGRYSFPGKKIFIAILGASIFIPLEFSMIPIFQLIKSLGLMDSLLGIILAEAGGGHVIFVLLFASFFRSVPKEMEEAAIIDGSSFIQIFTRVMLPLSSPIIGSVVIMQFVWTWNSFLLPLVLTLSNASLRPLAVGLYTLRGENIVDWTGIAAGSSIAIIPVIILFVFFQRYFIDGLSGAVKG
ncbi:L-arabinose transport system permease protein AraQ [Paraliobacillus sp. PM-2]|uniref:carbohydrate ABC transporter permease n=1 Tax=Paraliobacillus sp. PM-2 TaxID=1462524 RepID=UPI00061B8FF1|nr:carbohydrate ABC transporter permease [Paraliobacillus sp. PM-2]CQR47230.1 L-arabinose transport system permease protein AraQ [Paraliobacillus sp. PM-2]